MVSFPASSVIVNVNSALEGGLKGMLVISFPALVSAYSLP